MSDDGSIDESLGSILKVIFTNPVKGVKIKNNLKKYAKYKLDIAVIDMDSVKKKQAALKDDEKLTDREKEKFDTAEKAKKEAIKNKIDAVNARIGELATTDALKKFSSMSKTKADLLAAQKLLKIAQGEEADALKLKIDKYKEDITSATDELEDYAKEESKPEAEAEANAEAQEAEAKAKAEAKKEAQEAIDKAKAAYDKVKDGEDEKAKLEAEIEFKQAQQKKAKLDDNDELFQGLGDDIEDIGKKISALDKAPEAEEAPEEEAPEAEEAPEDKISKIESDITQYNKNIEEERTRKQELEVKLKEEENGVTTGRGSIEKVQSIKKQIEDSVEDITELKKKEAAAKKELDKVAAEAENASVDNSTYKSLVEKLNSFVSQLETNVNFNKTPEARVEVEKRITKWNTMLSEMNELNSSSIESALTLDMAQLEKDLLAINSKKPEQQSEQVRLAMQEAAALGGARKSQEQVAEENVAKLDKTRELMKRAGLI